MDIDVGLYDAQHSPGQRHYSGLPHDDEGSAGPSGLQQPRQDRQHQHQHQQHQQQHQRHLASSHVGYAEESGSGRMQLGKGSKEKERGFHATSSATLNSILTTTAEPILGTGKSWGISKGWMDSSASTSTLPEVPPPTTADPSEQISCICGIQIDDGFSIACDVCSRWCHTACFSISAGRVPEEFVCWVCRPVGSPAEVEELKQKAHRMQSIKLLAIPPTDDDGLLGVDGQQQKKGRRLSPGVERKQRSRTGGSTGSASIPATAGAGEGKRKRRPSVAQPHTPSATAIAAGMATTTPHLAEEDAGGSAHVEIEEPWAQTYVSIAQDLITDDDTRTRLRQHAQRWRGVTALQDDHDDPPYPTTTPVHVPHAHSANPPPIAVKPLSPFHHNLTTSSPNPMAPSPSLAPSPFAYNPDVLPPSYAVHTTAPIPSHSLITPFTSHIMPSSVYLADPLNAYAHLGMPKPFVHLLGPPLGVALDARGVGSQARFVRWGCRPNAAIRPVLCERAKEIQRQRVNVASENGKGKGKAQDEDEASLAFGVFALRDLKEGEEVVLGWEWDDGNVVHKLPALLRTPSLFPPLQIPHIKNQMANLLHALASSFVACACGAKVHPGEGCTGVRPPHHTQNSASTKNNNVREDANDAFQHQHQPTAADDDDTESDAEDAQVYAAGAWSPRQSPPTARRRPNRPRNRETQKEVEERCALASMAGFVGRHVNEDGMGDDRDAHDVDIDLGPLVGAQRGFRTRERVRFGGGFGGVEHVPEVDEPRRGARGRSHGMMAARGRDRRKNDLLELKGRNGSRRAEDEDVEMDNHLKRRLTSKPTP